MNSNTLDQPLAFSGAPAAIHYRPISSLAVLSVVCGLISIIGLADWTLLMVLPPLAALVSFVALYRILKQRDQLAGERLALASLVIAGAVFFTGTTLHAYTYMTEVPEGYDRLNFNELQPDPNDPGQLVPPKALEKNGQRVFLKGYMYPGRQSKGIREFMLVWNNGDCCFGGEPPLTHMILVRLQEPLTVDFTTRARSVAGVFRVEPGSAVDGLADAIYHLDGEILP